MTYDANRLPRLASRFTRLESETDRRSLENWTQQELADELQRLNAGLDRATIGKIEAGYRGISLDDAFALSVALSVAPINLFMPIEPELVRIGDVRIGMPLARQWVRGNAPLGLEGEDAAFYRTQAPDEEWRPPQTVEELLADLEVLTSRLKGRSKKNGERLSGPRLAPDGGGSNGLDPQAAQWPVEGPFSDTGRTRPS